jgi:hypothetical protein
MIDDEVSAHTRVTVLAYWKFESVSLQRRVRVSSGQRGDMQSLEPSRRSACGWGREERRTLRAAHSGVAPFPVIGTGPPGLEDPAASEGLDVRPPGS